MQREKEWDEELSQTKKEQQQHWKLIRCSSSPSCWFDTLFCFRIQLSKRNYTSEYWALCLLSSYSHFIFELGLFQFSGLWILCVGVVSSILYTQCVAVAEPSFFFTNDSSWRWYERQSNPYVIQHVTYISKQLCILEKCSFRNDENPANTIASGKRVKSAHVLIICLICLITWFPLSACGTVPEGGIEHCFCRNAFPDIFKKEKRLNSIKVIIRFPFSTHNFTIRILSRAGCR